MEQKSTVSGPSAGQSGPSAGQSSLPADQYGSSAVLLSLWESFEVLDFISDVSYCR